MLLEVLTISMIAKGIKWFKTKTNPVFMEWKDYKKKVDFLDMFHFQQSTRLQSIRNLELVK